MQDREANSPKNDIYGKYSGAQKNFRYIHVLKFYFSYIFFLNLREKREKCNACSS